MHLPPIMIFALIIVVSLRAPLIHHPSSKVSRRSSSKQATGGPGSSSRATAGKQGKISPTAGCPESSSRVTISKEAHSVAKEGPIGIFQIVAQTAYLEVQKFNKAASLRKQLSEFTMEEGKEINRVEYFMSAIPMVIRIEYSKSFSIKRIVRHLQSVDEQ